MVTLGLALALALLLLGAAAGAAIVHLAHGRQGRASKPPAAPAESTVEIDEAMGLDVLAKLVAVLEQLDPTWTRRVVEDMKHRDVLAIYLTAALAVIVSSNEMVRRVRSTADALLVAKSWDLPDAERPERET